MSLAIPQSDADRALSALLLSVLAAIEQQLSYEAWNGFSVVEPDAPDVVRARLVHIARLRVDATKREYNVSAHLFERIGATTAPHDHRYPMAVYPFAAPANAAAASTSAQADEPLYAMTWIDARGGEGTREDARNEVLVRAGDVWAIADPRRVRHTVRTLAPHASIILADVTDAPTREDRMITAPLPPEEITRVRERVRTALTAHRAGGISAGEPHHFGGNCGGPDVED